jgi:hypothetical protein
MPNFPPLVPAKAGTQAGSQPAAPSACPPSQFTQTGCPLSGANRKHLLVLSFRGFNPRVIPKHSLDLPIGVSTDRAMEAWYHRSIA